MKQPRVYVNVTTIYTVAKLKKEVSYHDFSQAVMNLYMEAKGNRPENVYLKYTDENNDEQIVNLKEAGQKQTHKTIRAVAAVAANIFLRNNDIDCETIKIIYCLNYNPSHILIDRGDIFSHHTPVKIKCRTIPDLIDELLK